jgi:hypothetical protein
LSDDLEASQEDARSIETSLPRLSQLRLALCGSGGTSTVT